MQKPPLDPDVADTAPSDPVLTVYDEEHLITYLRLLDAEAERADWREVARIVLHLDPREDSDRARRALDSHLSRAKWMTEHGYRHLLCGGASRLWAAALIGTQAVRLILPVLMKRKCVPHRRTPDNRASHHLLLGTPH